MSTAANETVPSGRPGGRAALLALGALLVVFAAIASYPPLMDVPWIRSSGAPVWVGFALAAAMAIASIRRDRRIWVRGIAGLALAFIAFGLFAFFVLARLPKTDALQVKADAPSVSVVDQLGAPITLPEAARSGPILLVFYRGFW